MSPIPFPQTTDPLKESMIRFWLLAMGAVAAILSGSVEYTPQTETLQLVPPEQIELACNYEPGMEVVCEN